MEPGLRFTSHRVSDSISAGSSRVTGQCVRPGVWPGFEFEHARLSWRCFYRETPSRQTNIRGFCSVSFTSLRVYLFQLLPVIFTYLRADCPCDVREFLDLTSFRLLTGSGQVTGQKFDPVLSLRGCRGRGHSLFNPKTIDCLAFWCWSQMWLRDAMAVMYPHGMGMRPTSRMWRHALTCRHSTCRFLSQLVRRLSKESGNCQKKFFAIEQFQSFPDLSRPTSD